MDVVLNRRSDTASAMIGRGARRVVLLATVAAACLFGGAAPGLACSCFEAPPCQVFWRAEVVFLGHVVSVGLEPANERVDRQVTILEVEEPLRGDASGRVRMVSASPPPPGGPAVPPGAPRPVMMSTCDYDFTPGGRYLVYARRLPDGHLTTTLCSGTKPAEEALDDLAFIQSIPGLPAGGRIFGSATRVFKNVLDNTRTRTEPAAGQRLLFSRERQDYEAVTGPDGRYELFVPPGEYAVRSLVPETVRAWHEPVVTVADRGCAPCSVSLEANGRIEGTVTTPGGRRVPRVAVIALPADATTDEQLRSATLENDTTDASGHFSIDALPPGRYVVGVNGRFGPRVESPYRAFHPASPTRAEATVVTLREGERKRGIDIVASPLPIVTVSGVVRDPEGRPIAGAGILAASADSPFLYIASTKSDSEGRFDLRLPGSTRYSLRAQTVTGRDVRTTTTEVVVADVPAECSIVLAPSSAAARP